MARPLERGRGGSNRGEGGRGEGGRDGGGRLRSCSTGGRSDVGGEGQSRPQSLSREDGSGAGCSKKRVGKGNIIDIDLAYVVIFNSIKTLMKFTPTIS